MKPTVPPESERWQRFNDTTGAISWNRRSANLHPDRCVCQELERGQNAGTPHKHYDDPPHACARCSECDAYRPAVPAAVPPEPAPPTPRDDFCGVCLHVPHPVAACPFQWEDGLQCKCTVGRHAAPLTVAPLVKLLREAAFWVGRKPDAEHVGEVRALSLALDAAADGAPTVAPARETEQLVRDLETAIHMVDDELIHGPDDPPHPRAKEFLAYRCRLRGHIDAAERDRASRSPGAGLRPQVAAFAQLMEAKLRANDHKGGWWHDGTDALMKRLRQETDELGDITEMSGAWCSAPPSAVLDASARLKVGHEAADVANFAMMIADVCGALRGEGPSPAREGKEPESPPLSGLDAATVEACERAAIVAIQAERLEDPVKDSDEDVAYSNALVDVETSMRRTFAGLRALATPPGQTKP